jgi:hypothetical protein
MAGLHYIISGLNMLEDYPNIKEYIKNFDGAGGFMYTTNIDPQYNAEIEKQMSDILDANGTHSGCSWGCMLRGIQSVLKGSVTREFIEEKIVTYEIEYNEYMRERELKREQQIKIAQSEELAQINDENAEYRIETDTSDKHL